MARRRRRRGITVELDLHGATHEEAVVAVHRFVNDHWIPGWRLRFVVGRRGRMAAVVSRVLSEYDLEPVEDEWNCGVVWAEVE